MSKKYPFDLASMIFGKNGSLKYILSGIDSILGRFRKVEKVANDLTKTKPLGLYPPGLPEGKQTPLLPSGNTSIVPINQELQTDTKTNFFTNTIKDAQTATRSIWQLFMNLLNKLRATASNIFTSTFTSIKSKTIKFTNSIKAQYYKATNQAFMTDENGRVTKASVEDSRMTVYNEKNANSEASKFSRMWQNHVNRVRDSVNRVKEDFTTIWQHHNERVNQSVKYASAQFNKLKISASNIFSQISNTISNVFDGIKNRYSKAIDFMKAKTLSIRNTFAKMTSKGKPAYTDETGKVRRTEVLPATYESDSKNTQQTYNNVKSSAGRVAAEVSRIWKQHIVNLRTSFTAVKNNISAIWQHHKARVADSTAYAESRFTGMTGRISAQFNKFRSVTSKVFSKISTVAKTVSVAVKGFFGDKIINPIVNKFNNMANKIKVAFNKIKASISTTANATAAAFKNKLGYNQDTTQATPSMFDALTKVQDQKLFIGNETEVAGILDVVNKKTAEGQVALQKYISTMGDGNDAVKAYVASLNGEKATMSGFNTFIQQHNAGVKASGIAAKAAAVGHALLNAALSMGLSVLIQFAMQGLQWLIDKIKDSIFVTQVLEEELETLQSDISNLNSEIDSLNSELETCNNRMAELLALPSLSFTEQEELRNLQLQTAELERQLELNKLLLKSKEKERTDKAKEWVNNAWDGDGTDRKYWVAGNGTIGEDLWWTPGVSGKEALETSLPKYETLKKEVSDMEKLYLSAQKQLDENGKLSTDIRKSIIDLANIKYPKAKSDEQIISALDNTINNNKDTLGRMETGINMVLGDMAKTISEYELSYSMGNEDINKFLDEYYAYSDAWNVAQGISAKSDVISNMFGTIASEEVQKLGESFREIANDENLSLDEQKSKIEGIINNLDKENDAYNALNTTMKTVGVTAQDIADYFVLETGAFDSSTIEGILSQYQRGIEVLKRLNSDKTQIEEELKQYGEGGTVDLLHRPQIDTTKLVEAGWKDAGDGIATVFSSTYSNEDSTIAINFTPILPNGDVLSPDELQEYAEGIIAGTREDDLKLQIGAAFEGEDAIAQAEAAAESIHNLQDIYYLPLEIELEDGTIKTVEWGDLFTKDDEGKWVAQTENISKVLNGCDETTREQFTKLAESVNSGEMEVEEAVRQLQLTGLSRAAELIENEFEGINKSMFKGLDDDISGLIDTFDELSSALENTASAMDTLDAAQTQMKNSNQISIKTALELISQTENWADVIDISNGKVVLAKGAEEALINERIQLIKTNLETARSQLVTQLATLNAAKASTYATSADITNAKAQKTYQEATKQSTAVTTAFGAVIGTLANALVDADTGEWRGIIAGLSTLGKGALTSAFSEAYSSAIKTLDSQEPDLPSEAELEKQINDIDAMLGMVGNISTASDFAKNYDYSETPGDKYEDKDSDKDKKTAKDLFDELAAEYDRKISTIEYKKDLIQSEIDKAEARGEIASEAFYQRQIELEEKNRQALVNKKKALEDYLKAQGKNMTKEEWADAQEEINSTALAIEECEKNVIDLGQAIDDVHWEYFDKFTSEVDDLGDENATLLSLVGDTDDAVDENGNWTASGVTQIGLNTQEMQRNLEMADQMQKEKNRIQKSWNAYQRVLAKHGGDASKVTKKEEKKIQKKYGVLITSESEYQEKMQETSQKQRDYAKAAKDSKDAIEDLAKARVDKEVEAIEKEIDAYKELISLKKKELEAERDLHDFKKDVDKKTRDIGETQRKIASLSGSTDPADIALRRKLEAELRDQQEDLDETFYDHAKEAQLNALDEEAEAYEKSQNEKIKVLEETLEDTETLITNAIMDMLINADTVLEQINTTAGLYGVSLSEELIAPWKDAAIKAGEYKEWIKTNIPNGVLAGVTDESGVITLFSNKMNEKINGPWGKAKTAVGNYVKYLGSKDVKNLPKLFTSWQTQIQNIANKWDKVKKAAEKAAQAQIDAANVRVPKNLGKDEKTSTSTSTSTSASTSTSTSTSDNNKKFNANDVKMLQQILLKVFGQNVDITGLYDLKTKNGVKNMQSKLKNSGHYSNSIDGLYGPGTYSALSGYVNDNIKKSRDAKKPNWFNGNAVSFFQNRSSYVPANMYAKGTLGTKKDEWAIDSEPQHGDELVVVPNKGVLSYMRKGTSVIPAKLTKNLMEWGKLNPNDKNSSGNVNLISNNVSKSEVKLNLGIDGLTNGNLSGLGKDVTDYIKDLTDSIQDTDKLIEDTTKDTDNLIKETIKDIVGDSTSALNTISNTTDKYKSPISTSLTTPWVNTIQKTNDFEIGAKSHYNKIIQHINNTKATLETALSTPYKNLTGDKKGNKVYEFLEYAKKTSIDNIISYANNKAKNVKTSLSKGFNDAKTSIGNFNTSVTRSINGLKSKFTDKKDGIIKVLNDTTQAAKNAKTAIENVPKYSGSSGGVGGKDIKALGGAVVPQFSYVSSPYGYRRDPKTGVEKFHGGTDFAAPGGSPIKAYADGIVKTAGYMANGYGNYVIIDHGSGNQTLYGHASRLHVKQGDQVKRGQLIADVGSTGYSTGNHLHFEYRKNGSVASPAGLPRFAKGTTGTKKDQWAVTDEPNFGDELKMYATPEGKLSFMRVGSTVVPADLTKELMDIADIGVDNLTMPKLNSDINLMSNYISKPELNISFDSMVHVDNCSQDTLKDLEKMVDSKINTFSRQLNYSLKRFSK